MSEILILAALDFIAKVIIAYKWPLVALAGIWILKKAVEDRVGGISLIKWKDWEIRFEPQVHPRKPPLRELNVRDTISLGTSPPPVRVITAITPGCGALNLIGASPSVSCQVRATLS